MTVKDAVSLKKNDRICNTKTGCIFEILEVIWDSRDPPEYLNKSEKDGNESCNFFTLFAKNEWIKL